MAQNREKEETLDLKVPADSPLSLSSCSDTCKISKKRPGSDLNRIDSTVSDKAERRSRSEKLSETERLPQRLAAGEAESASNTTKKSVNRCSGCAKRVGLTGFRCRCGDLFCSEHRYSDRHDCSFDYKTAGREAIARENPLVRAAKILKV